MSKKILISGGSGLVGGVLTALLQKQGYTVAHLSRTADYSGSVKAYAWDYQKRTMDEAALKDVHAIIHLAGAGIADKRWTDKRKEEIIDSRVQTAELLYANCAKTGHWPKVFVSASGINYYGSTTSDKIYSENDRPSDSFIGECCVRWEDAARQFENHSRVAMLRTGVVLSAQGGALPKIAAPVKWGAGAALGSGMQWMPYIHMEDLCRMYLYAIENEMMRGPYNACNGDHINNRTLTQSIAKVLKKPLWLPNVPAFVLKAAFGEMSEILLEGSRASAQKISAQGFRFNHATLEVALRSLYGKS